MTRGDQALVVQLGLSHLDSTGVGVELHRYIKHHTAHAQTSSHHLEVRMGLVVKLDLTIGIDDGHGNDVIRSRSLETGSLCVVMSKKVV